MQGRPKLRRALQKGRGPRKWESRGLSAIRPHTVCEILTSGYVSLRIQERSTFGSQDASQLKSEPSWCERSSDGIVWTLKRPLQGLV